MKAIIIITTLALLAIVLYGRHQCRLTKKQHERIKKWLNENVEK